MSSRRRSFIVGLSWKKIGNQEKNGSEPSFLDKLRKRRNKHEPLQVLRENEIDDKKEGEGESKVHEENFKAKSRRRRSADALSIGSLDFENDRMSRVQSVKDVLGSLKHEITNKFRSSTRRRQRLAESSPYSTTNTPMAARTHASRVANRADDVKMYSPFNFESPRRTPRMGVRAPRRQSVQPNRVNFDSPGQVQRDLNSLCAGIQSLNQIADSLNGGLPRQDSDPGLLSPVRRSPRLQGLTPSKSLDFLAGDTPSRRSRTVRTNPNANPTVFV